jgi:hypothetical protein
MNQKGVQEEAGLRACVPARRQDAREQQQPRHKKKAQAGTACVFAACFAC